VERERGGHGTAEGVADEVDIVHIEGVQERLQEDGRPGFVEDISGAGILKSSPHKQAAQRFLAFLASPPGQEVLAHSSSYEYPLVKNVAPNPALPPLGSFKPNSITPAEIGTGLDARDLLREAGLI